MPDVLIEVRGAWLGGRKDEFLHAIHSALIASLQTDPEDKVVRLVEYKSDDFIIPTPASDKFTRIEIEMFVGRSLEAKRTLYRSMVEALVPFGVPVEDVKIVLVEVPLENVGIRGGQAACDVQIAYKIDR
jgi:hypothetical protein